MSNKNHNHIWARGVETVVVAGSFAPASTSAPTAVKGTGFTVAYTSTGKFTITFDSSYYACISFVPGISSATAVDMVAMAGAVSASAGTAVIYTWDISSAAVADPAVNADTRVSFIAHFQNSSAG